VAAHHAVVHDDVEPGGACPRGRQLIDDAILQPHRVGAHRDRIVDDGPDELRSAKDINHVDGVGDVSQRGVGALAEHLVDIGVDRDDAIADAL